MDVLYFTTLEYGPAKQVTGGRKTGSGGSEGEVHREGNQRQ